MPAAIWLPRPRGAAITRAPAAAAHSQVPSVLPPSATITSGTPRIAARVSGSEREAFSVGMMTEGFAGMDSENPLLTLWEANPQKSSSSRARQYLRPDEAAISPAVNKRAGTRAVSPPAIPSGWPESKRITQRANADRSGSAQNPRAQSVCQRVVPLRRLAGDVPLSGHARRRSRSSQPPTSPSKPARGSDPGRRTLAHHFLAIDTAPRSVAPYRLTRRVRWRHPE